MQRIEYNIYKRRCFEMDARITKHNNDIIMKAMIETFKDKTLKVFGLETAKIVEVIPTVLPVLEVKENRTSDWATSWKEAGKRARGQRESDRLYFSLGGQYLITLGICYRYHKGNPEPVCSIRCKTY